MTGVDTSTSPLDPAMSRFLQAIDATPSGFLPGSQSKDLAAALDVPDGLIEALFVSARSRNFIRPDYERRTRRAPWILSAQGRTFLDRYRGRTGTSEE